MGKQEDQAHAGARCCPGHGQRPCPACHRLPHLLPKHRLQGQKAPKGAALGQSVAQEWPSHLKGQRAVLGHGACCCCLPHQASNAARPLSPRDGCVQHCVCGSGAPSCLVSPGPVVTLCSAASVPSTAPVITSILSGLVQQMSGAHTIQGSPFVTPALSLEASLVQSPAESALDPLSCTNHEGCGSEEVQGSHGAALSSSCVRHRLPVRPAHPGLQGQASGTPYDPVQPAECTHVWGACASTTSAQEPGVG